MYGKPYGSYWKAVRILLESRTAFAKKTSILFGFHKAEKRDETA